MDDYLSNAIIENIDSATHRIGLYQKEKSAEKKYRLFLLANDFPFVLSRLSVTSYFLNLLSY